MTHDDLENKARRYPGCRHAIADHERAADHIVESEPALYRWIEEHPDGLPDDIEMHKRLWRAIASVLPDPTLKDIANVQLDLRLRAHPLSQEEKAKVDKFLRRSRERGSRP